MKQKNKDKYKPFFDAERARRKNFYKNHYNPLYEYMFLNPQFQRSAQDNKFNPSLSKLAKKLYWKYFNTLTLPIQEAKNVSPQTNNPCIIFSTNTVPGYIIECGLYKHNTYDYVSIDIDGATGPGTNFTIREHKVHKDCNVEVPELSVLDPYNRTEEQDFQYSILYKEYDMIMAAKRIIMDFHNIRDRNKLTLQAIVSTVQTHTDQYINESSGK